MIYFHLRPEIIGAFIWAYAHSREHSNSPQFSSAQLSSTSPLCRCSLARLCMNSPLFLQLETSAMRSNASTRSKSGEIDILQPRSSGVNKNLRTKAHLSCSGTYFSDVLFKPAYDFGGSTTRTLKNIAYSPYIARYMGIHNICIGRILRANGLNLGPDHDQWGGPLRSQRPTKCGV